MSRWVKENLGTPLLSLLLAVLVWVVAIMEGNPMQEKAFPQGLGIEIINLSPDLVNTTQAVYSIAVSVRAPLSVWETLSTDQIHITADLAGLSPGTHRVPLRGLVENQTARVTRLKPDSIQVTLEKRATRDLPVRIELVGNPATGYEAGPAVASLSQASVSGPVSAVDRVGELVARLTLTDRKADINDFLTLVPISADGRPVSGVTISPPEVQVSQPIRQKTGFRDVAVKVVITGQVASGYRISNITVAPPVITLSSANPQQVNELPGFVETQPIDINEASDDLTRRAALLLPPGVSPVGEQSVVVQISIAAIHSSLTVQRRLELQGLTPGLTATPSPDTVDVILSGPLPVLDRLEVTDVRIILDLTGLEPGTHQVTPQAILLSEQLLAESILPSPIEVVITRTTTLTPFP